MIVSIFNHLFNLFKRDIKYMKDKMADYSETVQINELQLLLHACYCLSMQILSVHRLVTSTLTIKGEKAVMKIPHAGKLCPN